LARGTRRRLPTRTVGKRVQRTSRRISRTVTRAPARTIKPKQITKTSSVRRAGQRFPPQAKQQRRKTGALKRRISRVNQLSRTRSVDIRKVSSGGFKIFAPRNTPPALTVGGQSFVQNPDTRPLNLNQLQIRQEQVRQTRKGITPRQIIDRNVDRATGFAFNVGTELFKGGEAIGGQIFQAGVSSRQAIETAKAKNIKRKQELKAQGKLPSQQPRGEPIITGEKIQKAGSGVAKFLGGGLVETAFVVTAGVTGLGALDRIFRTGEGIQRQSEERKEKKRQDIIKSGIGTGGLFGIGGGQRVFGDLNPELFEASDLPLAQNVTLNRPPSDLEPTFSGLGSDARKGQLAGSSFEPVI